MLVVIKFLNDEKSRSKLSRPTIPISLCNTNLSLRAKFTNNFFIFYTFSEILKLNTFLRIDSRTVINKNIFRIVGAMLKFRYF